MAPPPLFRPGFALPLLWEDRHFIVINKPAGLAVHPGPQTRDSVESRLTPQKRGGPWLVHRLDTDTAGCLLVALRKTALIAAQKAFATHQTTKHYWALVSGKPTEPTGSLTTAIKRVSSPQQGWKMVCEAPHEGTKAAALARTSWRVLAHDGSTSLLELTLHTGKTHQARVHCAALGTPIIGDRLYGRAEATAPLALLARSLDVPLPLEDGTAHTAPHRRIHAIAHHEQMDAFLQNYKL